MELLQKVADKISAGKDYYDHALDALSYSLMTEKVYHKHDSDNWGTPQALFDKLQQEFQLDVDAAADELSAKCGVYFTQEMNALELAWFGKVFVNPPYSQVSEFVEKAIQEVDAGNCQKVVMLVAARVDTKWFWQASMYAGEVRFLKGRLHFEVYGAPTGEKFTAVLDAAPFPSCVLVFDKSITERVVRWWDWKQDDITLYAYQQKQKLIGEHTPKEIKDLMLQVDMLSDKLKQQMMQESMVKEAGAKASALLEAAGTGKFDKMLELFALIGSNPSSHAVMLLQTWMNQHALPWDLFTAWQKHQKTLEHINFLKLYTSVAPPPPPVMFDEIASMTPEMVEALKAGALPMAKLFGGAAGGGKAMSAQPSLVGISTLFKPSEAQKKFFETIDTPLSKGPKKGAKPITKVPEKFFGVATEEIKAGEPVTTAKVQTQGVMQVPMQINPTGMTYEGAAALVKAHGMDPEQVMVPKDGMVPVDPLNPYVEPLNPSDLED